MPESRHASDLRRLGLEPMPQLLWEMVLAMMWREMGRAGAPPFAQIKGMEFSTIPSSTLVLDEEGGMWFADREVNPAELTALGFVDKTEATLKTARDMSRAHSNPNLN